jgi:hypothetical protein
MKLMAILETSVILMGDPLYEKQYYNTDAVLEKTIRNSLLQAIDGLAKEAFDDEIQSFSLGEYSIVLIAHELKEPNTDAKANLQMYCIIEKDTDEKAIKESMHEAMNQFLNRFSINDIFSKKKKKFKKFPTRLDNIFKDLILKSEDRFKSLF